MNSDFFTQLETALATERLDAYRRDGVDEITTLSRYLLNMALCESLYSPLQLAEIALRNAIHTQLTTRYGGEDWYDRIPAGHLLGWQSQQILNSKDQLNSSRKPITPGSMVAELHFGFWTAFFNRSHARTGVGHFLSYRVFSHAPVSARGLSQQDSRWQQIRELRNRVFHHERILHWVDLNQQHLNLLESIKWISPALEEAASALDRFRTIRREGLGPWKEKIQQHWPRVSSK
jgi:hypothetical protein